MSAGGGSRSSRSRCADLTPIVWLTTGKAVLAGSFIQRAASYETRFGTIPTFAAKVHAVRERLMKIERNFRARYREALEQWRAGARAVVFPFGTWGMRVVHHAAVDEPDPA